ncbi:DUF512 domain-containing protein [candidate division KSB1 bacterium]|nr:DUF512 domain-containing protein [candidate division KSB1 bacterium]
MIIKDIYTNGLAFRLGLHAGDHIEKINGHIIKDVIDFQYWYSDDIVKMTIRRGPKTFIVEFEPGENSRFGAEFENFKYKKCGNHCIFCFIDQNPKGMRSSLYFKDEDYRLSFLYGNYVTLTTVSQSELDRIVQQRLSPLYISVHALDPTVRHEMLGLRRPDKLEEKLAFLSANGIEMHAQIVLCTAINDGRILEKTVDELAMYYPQLKTAAIVPVGLTRHRHGLTPLVPVDGKYAKDLFVWYKGKIKEFQRQYATAFVFLADEFYLLADEPFPPVSFYEDFYQIENGVGMVREFWESFNDIKAMLPKRIPQKKLTIVTGKLAGPLLKQHILPVLSAIRGLAVNIVEINNEFYGLGVTVSGLLVGEDIANQIQSAHDSDLVVLPPNCLNENELFLDNWTIPKLEEKIGTRVKQISSFLQVFETL